MPELDDPLSAAVAGRGSLYNLSTATQPGQGALDVNQPYGEQTSPLDQIEGRRQFLIQRLPYVNRRDAYNIGTELRALNASYRQTQYEAAQAENQRRWEATQGRLIAHDRASQAAQGLKIDRERSIDEQGANLMTGLGRLDAMHRRGLVNDDEYDQTLLDLGQQNQLGLHHPVASKMYEHFITESDKRNAFNVRRLTSESAKIAARYGVEPQIDPDTGLPSLELTKAAGLTTDKGRAELFKQLNDEMTQKYGVPTGIGSLFNPIQPHTKGPKTSDKQETINLPFLDKDGTIKAMTVPMGLFNQMKADFQDRYNIATNVPSAEPVASAAPSSQQAAGGLQVGAQRTVGGKNYSWNGTRWEAQ